MRIETLQDWAYIFHLFKAASFFFKFFDLILNSKNILPDSFIDFHIILSEIDKLLASFEGIINFASKFWKFIINFVFFLFEALNW